MANEIYEQFAAVCDRPLDDPERMALARQPGFLEKIIEGHFETAPTLIVPGLALMIDVAEGVGIARKWLALAN